MSTEAGAPQPPRAGRPLLARQDVPLVAIVLGLAGFLFASMRLDLFEAAVRLVQAGEAWELDEMVGVLFLGGVAATALLARRTRDLRREIARREIAEQKALEQAELLSLAQRAAGAGAWSFDLALGVTTLSPAAREMLGLPDDHHGKVRNEEWPEFLDPADIEALSEAIVRAAREGGGLSREYRFRGRDGRVGWLQSIGRIVEDSPGQGQRLIGLTFDATERVKAAQDLQESEERLRLALEAAGDGAWEWDIPRQSVSVSDQLVQNLGYDSRRFDGDVNNFLALIHRDDLPRMRQAFTDHLAGRTDSYRCEYRLRSRDRAWRWNLDRGRVVARDPATGRATRIVGTSSDITAFKNAEQQALDQANLLALAQGGAGAGAWSHDLVTRVTTLSPEAKALIGLPATHSGVITLADWADLMHPDDVEPRRVALSNAIKQETDYSAEYRIRQPGGGFRWFQSLGRIVDNGLGQQQRLIGLLLDVTDRKEAEIELQRVQGELIHLSRLSAMGDMASTLAHELNQPLTAMANFARGIRHCADLDGQEFLVEAVDGIERSAERAGEIVRRLREYVLSGEVERREVSLSQIVKDACGLALVDAGCMGVEHRIELDGRADTVLADKVQIQQVLLNLVRNAVEAMAASGAERRLRVSSRRCGRKQVEIAVADSGPGIPDLMLPQLFTPFVSTKTEGMGVGLSICRTIVEAHGGRIWAESAPGGGSIMRFTLPRA